jgi:uncharacterized protein
MRSASGSPPHRARRSGRRGRGVFHTRRIATGSRSIDHLGARAARCISHCCDTNCATAADGRRIFIDAVRQIGRGEELGDDHPLERDGNEPPAGEVVVGCRGAAAVCCGTTLLPPLRPPARPRGRRAVLRRA